ncbi:MAG: DNA polymerase III subunit delta [Gammaproteobacteria bacterium]|nr:DNA polymerase III subunit delta [Gammaproteobacteria bacterium]NNJ85138.1 DNA polymerase III subunit delta [Gammaproteobacteria bacterium]
MQLKPEQLPAHLKRGLSSIYIISGDEPLQTGEVLAAIRQSARDMGFTERVVLYADARFDWEIINQYADSPSLFGDKRLLDVRMSGAGPGQQGSNALIRYASRPGTDQVMLLSTGQLDAKQRKSKWHQSLERAGAGIAIWPVDARNLPHWIKARMRHRGMTITDDAVDLLAERMEGNLLACAQEIEKLTLLRGTRGAGEQSGAQQITLHDVLQCVVDSAHFDAFGLVDSTLAGDARRTVRIFSGLREEGTDPLPILGMLVWEIREVVKIADELAGGANFDQVIGRQPALRRRKQVIASALRRQERTAWLGMLCVAQYVDQIIKGARKGNPWEALMGLALLIAGVEIPFPDAGVIP